MKKRMEDDMLLHVQDQIGDVLYEARKTIEMFEEAAENLKENWFKYVAILDSLWADYGEKTIEYRGLFDEDINDVIIKAEKKFMDVNKRSDVQARRRYFVEFWNDIRIEITQFLERKRK